MKTLIPVIFVNPVEFHGPHLPLSTDYDISLGLFRDMEKALTKTHPEIQFLLRPPIQKGCNPATGPGSERTNMAVLSDMLRKECENILDEMKEYLPRHVLFMTFHGAPRHAAAIESAIEFLRTKNIQAYNPFNLSLIKLRDYNPEWVKPLLHLIPDEAYREHWLHHLPEDFHGGTFESSLVLYYAPDKVKDYKNVPDCPDRSPGLKWKSPIPLLWAFQKLIGISAPKREWEIAIDALHWEKSANYPGYTGSPKNASGELGEKVSAILLKDYLACFHEILSGKRVSPKPILQWTLHFN